MGDLVQDRQANFLAQLVRIGKIFQQRLREYGNLVGQQRRVERGAVGERDALVNTVQRIFARIEAFGQQEFFAGPRLDNDLDVAQLLAELFGQLVDDPGDFFSNFAVIQR